MTKRIVEISSQPARLSTEHEQLLIRSGTGAEAKELYVPLEDLGLLVLDHPQCSLSLPVLARLGEYGALVVVCDAKHLPVSLVLPISTHGETVHRIAEQIAAGLPRRKQLWKQIVSAKITAQARLLQDNAKVYTKLKLLAGRVRSGDSTNLEAQAARIYWQHWGKAWPGFTRDAEGGGLNGLLNYGYAIVRAGTARALVGSGFCTAIGLHHHNRANPFCLADDLMEPLRPLVDERVARLAAAGELFVSTEAKRALLSLMLEPVLLNGQVIPLMDSLQRMSASLAKCLRGEEERLLLPLRLEA